MKTSVIYKVGGFDIDRSVRIETSIKAIRNCKTTDYEIVAVEQVMDGRKYYSAHDFDKYFAIESMETKLFNVAWCGNVAARLARGERIVFVDADIVVPPNYLDELEQFDIPYFAHGGDWYTPLNAKDSEDYISHQNYYITETFTKRYNEVYQPTFQPYLGHGYIRIFNKRWYWDVLGGHVEDFLVWGFEDTELILDRIPQMMYVGLDEIPSLNAHCFHLWHDAPRDQGYSDNFQAFEKLKTYTAVERCRALVDMNVGDFVKMKPLLPRLEGRA